MVLISDIEAAAKRNLGHVPVTPLLSCPELDRVTHARVRIKAECLQRTGSFKFRGAFNRLSQLDEQQCKAGVVAWSSGNHAQGIAAAAQILGIHAAIVMPSDAPRIKVERTRAYGAEIVEYDRYTEDREAIGHHLSRERGATLVPSYDDEHIIAGQGTCGLEIVQQCQAQNIRPDAVLICTGGGGLIAGSSIALKSFWPDTSVYAVEPTDFGDHKASLELGRRVPIPKGGHSICDALLAPIPGEVTFPINAKTLTGGLTVSDFDVRAAMRFAFQHLKLVVEPGGAVALAALLSGKIDVDGQDVVVVVTGGNVDPAFFAEILRAA